MFAIVENGGKQYRVAKGDTIVVDRLDAEEGKKVELGPVEAAARDNVSLVTAAAANADRPNIRLRNDPLSEGSRFTITAGDRSFAAVVPAGESRVFQLDAPVSEVRVEGVGQPFDNRLFLAPREPALVKLLFLGDGKPGKHDL